MPSSSVCMSVCVYITPLQLFGGDPCCSSSLLIVVIGLFLKTYFNVLLTIQKSVDNNSSSTD